MKRWIKQNLVLLSGIVLPALLVGGFFILSNLPRQLADPPQYDFLLVGYRYDYQHPANYYLNFEVRDGRLTGKVVPKKENNAGYNRQLASIYRYSAAHYTFEEIEYDLPEDLEELEEAVPLTLEKTSNLQLDKRSISPDGYKFEYLAHRGRGGLLGEMFGMGRRYDSNYVLKKDRAYFDLPVPSSDTWYQDDLHFMGWIVEEGGTP